MTDARLWQRVRDAIFWERALALLRTHRPKGARLTEPFQHLLVLHRKDDFEKWEKEMSDAGS